jgi:adenylate cyclase
MAASTDRVSDTRPGKKGGLRQKLMQLSMTLTGIGVALLVVSLIAVAWLRANSNQLALERTPAVVATQHAQIGLQRSLAGLRGWVALGDKRFRLDRRAAWTEQIEPAIDELEHSGGAWSEPADRDHLAELAALLDDLKESQWWVEDVAQTEGNQPALHALRQRVVPISSSLSKAVEPLVANWDLDSGVDGAVKWKALTRFRRSLTSADDALARFVSEGEERWRHAFIESLDDAEFEFERLASWPVGSVLDRAEQLTFIALEFPSYARFAREAMAARQGDRWNVALHLMNTETVPLTLKATELLDGLAASQAALMDRDTKAITFAGAAAMALSSVLILLMAVLAYALASYRSGQITLPVIRLSDAAEDLANGLLHKDVPLTTDDELATLTDSFNRMRVKLQQSEAALKQSNRNLHDANQDLERHGRFVRDTFGRYLSDDVVSNLLDTPGGLQLGGENRQVTILMSDLRGFTSMAARLTPEQVVSLLNRYLSAMVEVTSDYQGTVDEFIGDQILVIFGAPVLREDHACRAVACATAMQLAMDSVNDANRRDGLPEIEMGIGVNTGEVVVGNIGSETRAKYGVVGSTVNLTSRIESYTVGGQILISEATRQEVGEILRTGAQFEIEAKGVDGTTIVHEVRGIDGDFGLFLSEVEDELVALDEAVALRFSVLEGKHLGGKWLSGSLIKLSARRGEVLCDAPVALHSNLKIQIEADTGRNAETGNPLAREFYAKVTGTLEPGSQGFCIHMTSLAPALARWLEIQRTASTQ